VKGGLPKPRGVYDFLPGNYDFFPTI